MTGPSAIRRMIPHRYPILLVDRIVDAVPGAWLVARTAVSGREPAFRGHLADDCAAVDDVGADPVLPVGLVCEAWAQAALLLVRSGRPNPDVRRGGLDLLTGVRGIEVRGAARPGDVIEHRVRLRGAVGTAWLLGGGAWVGAREIVRVGQLTVVSGAPDTTGPEGGGR
ncbi:MAG TPA: beta-hydroxyacyl-ACP dehydratase [Pilimelia sp.]|nr:beta-hydroxyacyl-ACP dehydratase [Pilimelia sp.]